MFKHIVLLPPEDAAQGEPHNFDILVDQKKITEITIDHITNSVVSTGSVSGDIVNSIV